MSEEYTGISKVVEATDWAANNIDKIKSAVYSVAIYWAGLEVAHQTKSVWEILTSGGLTSAITITAGVLTALVSGWRTKSGPTEKQVRRAEARAARNAQREEIDAAV